MRTRDAELRELLDAQTLDDAALRRNLRDIRLINRLLGWTAFTVREVARHVRSRGMEDSLCWTWPLARPTCRSPSPDGRCAPEVRVESDSVPHER